MDIRSRGSTSHHSRSCWSRPLLCSCCPLRALPRCCLQSRAAWLHLMLQQQLQVSSIAKLPPPPRGAHCCTLPSIPQVAFIVYPRREDYVW